MTHDTRDALDEVVDDLYRARLSSTEVEIDAPPLDLQQGLRLQLEVSDRFAADGIGVGGWKLGWTSGSLRAMMGEDFRPFGYVRADRVLQSGATVALAGIPSCSVEPELVLRLGEDLEGPVDAARARAAVDAVAAGFEINEKRLAAKHAGNTGLVIADGLVNWGIVIGELVEDFAGIDGLAVVLERDGVKEEPVIAGVNLEIDDPFLSLARLATELSRFGRKLHAGQHVITGAFSSTRVEAASSWSASFSSVGSVAVELV